MTISQQIKTQMEKASWIRRMFTEGMELKKLHGADKVFDFTLGNPVFEPPPEFKKRLVEVAQDPTPGQHRYMPNIGFPAVRESIARFVSSHQDVKLTADHVIMTTGAASALNVVLKAVLDPGDEVIVLAPYFVEYLFYVSNHQGDCRIVETDETFGLDLEAIRTALGPRTKALILNSPNNPTGVIYPAETLRRLAAVLEEHRHETGRAIYVISDEPYRRLVYDGQTVPPVLSIFPDAIFCTSHAKDLSIPGERIGYIALGPRCDGLTELADACAFTIRVLGFVNAPAIMQRTVASLQQASVDVEKYRKLRDLFYEGITDAGYDCMVPQGAFYLFPRTPIDDDVAFVQALMKHRVLTVPGSGFGRAGHFRLAYCVSAETIERALPAFRTALQQCS
jgi:aspartate aminotransferase